MGMDENQRAAGKPPSARLEAQWVREDVGEILAFLDQLAAALVIGDENMRRAKVLSAVALWSSRASRS